jgi:hypothetical protein
VATVVVVPTNAQFTTASIEKVLRTLIGRPVSSKVAARATVVAPAAKKYSYLFVPATYANVYPTADGAVIVPTEMLGWVKLGAEMLSDAVRTLQVAMLPRLVVVILLG